MATSPSERECLCPEGGECPVHYELFAPHACEFAGHEWTPAGGGLLICIICEAEKWEEVF